MRFMMIVKATKESEAGAMPGEKTADMAKYNEKTEVVTDGRLHGCVEGCVIGRVESPKIIASLARTVRELLLTRAPRRIRSSCTNAVRVVRTLAGTSGVTIPTF